MRLLDFHFLYQSPDDDEHDDHYDDGHHHPGQRNSACGLGLHLSLKRGNAANPLTSPRPGQSDSIALGKSTASTPCPSCLLRKILERFEMVFLDSYIGNVGGLTQRGRPSLAQPYTSLLGLVVPYIPESLEPCQAASWACYVGQRCSYMGHHPGG